MKLLSKLPKLSSSWDPFRALRGWLRRAMRLLPIRQRRTSLVSRLVLLQLSGIVVSFVVGVVGLYWTSDRIVENTLKQQALQWIAEMEELGPSQQRALDDQNRFLVENRLQHFPEIEFVRYYDRTGSRVLQEYGTKAAAIPLPTASQLEELSRRMDQERVHVYDRSVPVGDSWWGGTFVRLLAPIRARSIASDGMYGFDPTGKGAEDVELIGYLDVGINPNLHRDSFTRNVFIAGSLAAVVFLGGLLLSHRLIRRALSPLLHLQEPLARLAKGEIDVRVRSRGPAEIARVGEALRVTIGALKRRDAVLRRLAYHDSLTGLMNRASFSRLLQNEISRAKRDSTNSAVLFIDLDRFKYINDMLGHEGGDRLLVQVAELLTRHVRETDAVARLAGDEFTVLARQVTRASAVEMAKKINAIMRDFHFAEQDRSFHVYCSIGVVMITAGSMHAEEILSQADTACLEAKSGGRNRFHLFERSLHVTETAFRDVECSERIKFALKHDQLKLIYQPILKTKEPIGEYYEVLLRVPDEDGKHVSPALFLPIAERFGLLADLDRWVIENALRLLAETQEQGRKVRFSINLSGQAFEDPTLVYLIKEKLTEYQIAPSAVVFEITEQIAVRYMNKAGRLMQSLTDIGCRLSLDDFGVGFSSFSYLKNFPVSTIKIDGSFIENLASSFGDQTMVKSIVQIAQAMGKEVVAEFVNDARCEQLLREYGIDYLQGYYIGEPSYQIPHPCFDPLSTKNGHGEDRVSIKSGATGS